MKPNLIISIDPAGVGSNGIIITNEKTKLIYFKNTFISKNESEARNYFIDLFKNLDLKTKNVLVLVENFYLNKNRTITNPLATAKLIGMLEVISIDIMKWNFATYEPKEKNKIIFSYKGNIKFTKHEKDALRGIILFRSKKW